MNINLKMAQFLKGLHQSGLKTIPKLYTAGFIDWIKLPLPFYPRGRGDWHENELLQKNEAL